MKEVSCTNHIKCGIDGFCARLDRGERDIECIRGSGLYKYRTDLFNEWRNSDECVTLEFEMWLVDQLKRKTEALEFAKEASKRECEYRQQVHNENQVLKTQLEALKLTAVKISWNKTKISAEDMEYLNEVKASIPEKWREDVKLERGTFFGIDVAHNPDETANDSIRTNRES